MTHTHTHTITSSIFINNIIITIVQQFLDVFRCVSPWATIYVERADTQCVIKYDFYDLHHKSHIATYDMLYYYSQHMSEYTHTHNHVRIWRSLRLFIASANSYFVPWHRIVTHTQLLTHVYSRHPVAIQSSTPKFADKVEIDFSFYYFRCCFWSTIHTPVCECMCRWRHVK